MSCRSCYNALYAYAAERWAKKNFIAKERSEVKMQSASQLRASVRRTRKEMNGYADAAASFLLSWQGGSKWVCSCHRFR